MKVAIVDDDLMLLKAIEAMLKSLSIECVGSATSYDEAELMFKQTAADVVILDIDLKSSKSGIDLGMLLNKEYKIPFIYLTANFTDEFLIQANATNPKAFLIKPFSKNNVVAALKLAYLSKQINVQDENVMAYTNNGFYIKVKGAYIKLEYQEILFVQSDHMYLDIYCKNLKKYNVREKLSTFFNSCLNDRNFIQIHRRTVVNADYIEKLEESKLTLKDNYELAVSRPYLPAILQLMKCS